MWLVENGFVRNLWTKAKEDLEDLPQMIIEAVKNIRPKGSVLRLKFISTPPEWSAIKGEVQWRSQDFNFGGSKHNVENRMLKFIAMYYTYSYFEIFYLVFLCRKCSFSNKQNFNFCVFSIIMFILYISRRK